MKILAFADVHLGNYRYPIRPYILDAMDQIEAIAHEEQPDIIIFAGDAFRWKVPPAEDLAAMGNFFLNLTRIAPVYAIPGNHDVLGSGVTTIDVYGPYYDFWLEKNPRFVDAARVQWVFLPWLPQKSLSDFGQGATDTENAQRALINILKARLDPNKTSVLIGHATALGAKYKEGVSSVLSGDVQWTNDLFEGFDISILGHIHAPQMVAENVIYTGSICPVSFNEVGQEKRIILWEDGHIHNVPLTTPKFRVLMAEDIDYTVDYSDYFLYILKGEDQPDPYVPHCLWYDIKVRPTEREIRLRLSEDTVNLSTEEVIARWLELEGYEADMTDRVLGILKELMGEGP